MVNIDIPKNYTASPSSFIGTPHLTINREATIDLDSSNAFEGPEKLLEVWFSPDGAPLPASVKPNGLKAVPGDVWKEMLDLVHCKVLSVVASEHVDAYLLSESSMFVFPHKVVLKTCGTTTLLLGLPRLLEICAAQAGFPGPVVGGQVFKATPYRVFYSRKNYLYPDQQKGPHRSWRDEVSYLDRLFVGGSAYMIGKMNGEHWYLYITCPNTQLTPPSTPDKDKMEIIDTQTFAVNHPACSAEGGSDETLEILMTDLDEQNARQFYLEEASAVAEGQYFQKMREATKDSMKHLGTITEVDMDGVKTGSPESTLTGSTLIDAIQGRGSHPDDSFNVFELQTSDAAEKDEFSSDDEAYELPEKLATEGHALGTVVSDTCGLSDVYPTSKYPEAIVDAYLFTPCGFSANGVVPAAGGAGGSNSTHYFTVHVTPEPQCSYASFETNVPAQQSGRETADIVEQVVRIFKPGRFSVTLFEAKMDSVATGEVGGVKEVKKTGRMECIKGYKRVDRIVHDLDGYDLVFRYYERDDWKGGQAPRLGENIF